MERATALLYQAKLLTDMGLNEASARVYEEYLWSFPETDEAEIARARLALLPQ